MNILLRQSHQYARLGQIGVAGIIQHSFAHRKARLNKDPDGPTATLQVPPLNNTLPNYTHSAVSPRPVTPRTQVTSLNDREIATAYLLTLKRAGREYAWAAMEASNPGLRSFLEDAFKMSSHHAYDVWQWMVKQGYYPLEAADPVITQTLGQFYEVVGGPASALQ